MRAIWLSDIHLNFILPEQRIDFYKTLTKTDYIFITGDIAEADTVQSMLQEMTEHVKAPILFVMGNHDYYIGSIQAVRGIQFPTGTTWLGNGKVVQATSETAIVGVDGWADMRHGWAHTYVNMNDENYIEELKIARLHRQRLGTIEIRGDLADNDACTLETAIEVAAKTSKTIIVLTHIPPYVRACKHKGYATEESVLPYYCSKATGDILDKMALEYPDIRFRVFCGHTHSKAYYKAHPNMIVKAGESEYFAPKVQQRLRFK